MKETKNMQAGLLLVASFLAQMAVPLCFIVMGGAFLMVAAQGLALNAVLGGSALVAGSLLFLGGFVLWELGDIRRALDRRNP